MVGENAPVAREFAQYHVHRFNRVSGINHLADLRYELEKRNNIIPLTAP